MLGALSRWLRGEDAGISVPPMDGVLKPNNRLEEAERLLTLPSIDNLAAAAGQLLCSSGHTLFRLHRHAGGLRPEPLAAFTGAITCLAAAPGGRLAVGVAGEGLRLGMVDGRWETVALPVDQACCAVAADFAPDGSLLVCVGSRQVGAADWQRDLMQHGRSGLILALDRGGAVETRLEGIAFPGGIAHRGDGQPLFSESWRHRVVALPAAGRATPLPMLSDLPAYPGRIAPASDGGLWLALFAPRRQLFEMVLREDGYRREMLDSIDPDAWIGPALSSAGGPDQPLQAGSVRQMGVIKPWAPSRSYGLVVRCGIDGRPVESWHSRADGTMHGITSVIEFEGAVLATSRGSGTLLRLPVLPLAPAAPRR